MQLCDQCEDVGDVGSPRQTAAETPGEESTLLFSQTANGSLDVLTPAIENKLETLSSMSET